MRDRHHFQADVFEAPQVPNKKKYDTYKKNDNSDWLDFTRISKDELDALATVLAKTTVDYNNILGYIADYSVENLPVICKYNKTTGLFISYTCVDDSFKFIKVKQKDWRTYTSESYLEYYDEIT